MNSTALRAERGVFLLMMHMKSSTMRNWRRYAKCLRLQG